MESRIFHLHALTVLHAGTGQGTGVIDLPVAREKATHLPLVPGSGIKGVLREELRDTGDVPKELWTALFGPETDAAAEHAGALAVGDALLLCLPVRSLNGTFAYATCPFILRRYRRDWGDAAPGSADWAIPTPSEEGVAVASGSVLTLDGHTYLEDLALAVDDAASAAAGEIARFIAAHLFPEDTEWQESFVQRFAILPDAVLDFLAETGTEIRARIRLTEQRTVAKGALWYEENLPAETVLWGLVACDRSRNPKLERDPAALLGHLPNEARLQIGGKATVGRGQSRWLLSSGTVTAEEGQ